MSKSYRRDFKESRKRDAEEIIKGMVGLEDAFMKQYIR